MEMKRPVMNPMFVVDRAAVRPSRPSPVRAVLRTVRLFFSLLLVDLRFWRARSRLNVEEGSLAGRFIRGLTYRLLFAPVLVVALVAVLVFWGTHPPRTSGQSDPLSQGNYYDPVLIESDGGLKLHGWLVPVIDARRVLSEREMAIRQKHPAVVLVHDFAASRYQMLPLIAPLHEAGFVVLAVSLRGSDSSSSAGCTFGIQESHDVEAAVQTLRNRTYVDASRIAVIAIGTGANAAMLAAERDPRIAALVLERPYRNSDQVVAEHLAPSQDWLSWLRPLCKWAFEFGYRVDADDLGFDRQGKLMSSRPVLVFGDDAQRLTTLRQPGTGQVVRFLHRALEVAGPLPTAAAEQRPVGR